MKVLPRAHPALLLGALHLPDSSACRGNGVEMLSGATPAALPPGRSPALRHAAPTPGTPPAVSLSLRHITYREQRKQTAQGTDRDRPAGRIPHFLPTLSPLVPRQRCLPEAVSASGVPRSPAPQTFRGTPAHHSPPGRGAVGQHPPYCAMGARGYRSRGKRSRR